MSFVIKRWFFEFFFLFFLSQSIAQKEYRLEIIVPDNQDVTPKNEYKNSFTTLELRNKQENEFINKLFRKGYLAATVDSIWKDSLTKKVYFNVGDIYKWMSLKKGNVEDEVLSQINFKEKLYTNKPLYYKDIALLQERLLSYYENNGYPFASVRLDSVKFIGNSVTAELKVDKNKQIVVDSIIVKGNSKITPLYLYNCLSIKPGDLYNEKLISKVDRRITEINFVKPTSPSFVVFTERQTKLVLNLEKKNASQFDGFIGVLPNNQTNRILFTGDIHLKLQNAIGRGELVDVNWRSLQKSTQDFKTQLIYPFLFSSPFGLDYSFKLYKRDSTFIEIGQNIGIQYLLTAGNYFKVFVNTQKWNLISTTGLEYKTTLPTYADVSSVIYGIGYKSEKLDYRYNPRSGYSLIVNAGVGSKSIKRNAKLNPVAYNNVVLNSTQYNLDLNTAIFLPIKSRSALKLGIKAAYLYSQSIFQNELYRIGGFKILRGFDEESISASMYSVFTAEYRYLLEQNSFLYLFADGAYYENNSISYTGIRKDTPVSFGGGISFETKAGIFSIGYALGKQLNNPIYLKSGKVQFGIVSYF